MTFSWTTALWDALPSDVPKGFTVGMTQYDSVEGTDREQSGPEKEKKEKWDTRQKAKSAGVIIIPSLKSLG